MTEDLNTPSGLLAYLLWRNEHGVWFIRSEGEFLVLPRWIWGHCERVMKQLESQGDA